METATDRWVLLVEDDETLAGLLIEHLARRGVAARVATTVADALVPLRAGDRPALIVLDINLPDAAGWSLTRDAAYAAAGRPPVIIASAVAVNPEQLAACGAAGHLPKPFPLRTFLDIVQRYTGAPHAAAEKEDR